jgi:hypothetical protein
LSNRIPLFVSVNLSFGRYDVPGTTHVIFVLYMDDATLIFQEPLRVLVIASLSSFTLRKAGVCYIQLYTMVQDELLVGL